MPIPGGPVAVNHQTGVLTYDDGSQGSAAVVSAEHPEAGQYFMLPDTSATAASTITVATLYLFPFVAWQSLTIDRIGFEITTAGAAGALARAAIYARDPATGAAGALVLDSGTTAADSTGVKNLTVSTALTAGLYWVGVVAQNSGSNPSARLFQQGTFCVPLPYGTSAPSSSDMQFFRGALTYTGVTGALPSSLAATSWGLGDRGPKMFMRAA